MTAAFGGCYDGRRVFLTGHTGFKGSWLALWLAELGAEVHGLALDPERKPNHFDLLGLELAADHRVDLCDRSALRAALARSRAEVVFHLAAQPLVRRGYRDPVRTFAVNVQALVELLEAIRTTPSVRAVVVVTTDKVYAEPVPSAGYVESDPLGAHDPYSSSKACAELVTDCYRRSFLAECGVLVASARAGNVIGGGDYSEDRLIPDCIRAVGSGHALKVRYPQATRPWQHVLEPLAGYLALGARLLAGVEPCARAWNFGPVGEPSWPVIAVLERCRARFPTLRIEPVGESQPREAAELRLDSSAAVEHLGWRPVWDTARAIERTLDWYAAALEHGECLSRAQLTRYLHEARERGVAWVA